MYPITQFAKAELKIKPGTQALVQFLLTHTHTLISLEFLCLHLIKSETTKNYCEKKKKKLVSQLTDLIPGGKGKDVSKAWDDWTNPQSGTFTGDVGL